MNMGHMQLSMVETTSVACTTVTVEAIVELSSSSTGGTEKLLLVTVV